MIIDSISLENFRVFKGHHTITLTPANREKPVILIGALNGGGKTSILDALKLVLYGKLANCSKKSRQSYSEFISECINDSVSPAVGCSIVLCFRTYIDGKEETYKISRSWRIDSGKVIEFFSVLVNNVENKVLQKSWEEFVDSFIPVKLSHLFFFDGEKIEEFASPESAKELLAQGVHSLLGIDTVVQLERDLDIVIKRIQAKNQQDDNANAMLDASWKRFSDLGEQRKLANDALNAQCGKRDDLRNQLNSAKKKFEKLGGNTYLHREEYELIIKNNQATLATYEKCGEEIVAGIAPLLLVFKDIEELIRQAKLEEESKRLSQIENTVKEIDQLVQEKLALILSDEQKKLLDLAFVQSMQEIFSTHNNIKRYLNISSNNAIEHLNDIPLLLKTEKHNISSFLEKATEVLLELESCRREQENIPATDIIQPVLAQLAAIEQAIAEHNGVVKHLQDEFSKIEQDYQTAKSTFIANLESGVNEKLAKQDDLRIIRHSQSISERLCIFRKYMQDKYINKIERYIGESFKQLLHKKTLVDSIRIDPSTYSIKLFGTSGEQLSPDKLSAGERQLLGVSMLWGLAKAAARPLPAVVDTPLGRLDSSHRLNLISRYFPEASHQVILLSTDEEIAGAYYKKLKPYISHAYSIEYDDVKRTSNIISGYAFEKKGMK